MTSAPGGSTRAVLDCRWLGIGGAGRMTELALRGLAERPAPIRWVLWGKEAETVPWAWPGAQISSIATDPRTLLGQASSFQVPGGDYVVFMHQQRPLLTTPGATFIYDTIPLRHGSGPRPLKRLFLSRVAHISPRILTTSEYSKSCIVRDLGVAVDRVDIVHPPFDAPLVERVRTRRSDETRAQVALYIGAFRPHKNLPRLLTAFAATSFRKAGGRLVLVGGSTGEASALVETLDEQEKPFVTVRPQCTQDEIDHLYATSLFLVQPSLEEGFGLPVWEALCCGLPVCVSDGGALPEVAGRFAEPFPARSVSAMAEAIDACASRAEGWDDERAIRQSTAVRDTAPTIREFGESLEAAVIGQLDKPQ